MEHLNTPEDEDRLWIFCHDGNEWGMKLVPRDVRAQSYLDNAAAVGRQFLKKGANVRQLYALLRQYMLELPPSTLQMSLTPLPLTSALLFRPNPIMKGAFQSSSGKELAFQVTGCPQKPQCITSTSAYVAGSSTEPLSLPAMPRSSSPFLSKLKGKEGKKRKKNKGKGKQGKVSTAPVPPSTEESPDQPSSPSSEVSPKIETQTSEEMPDSLLTGSTPTPTFEATPAAPAEVEVTGEVAVDVERETLVSLPASRPLTFETTLSAHAVEIEVTGEAVVAEISQLLLARTPLTFETITADPPAEIAVTGDVLANMEITTSPSIPPLTIGSTEAATYPDFDLTMCPEYPPYWHIHQHGSTYYQWCHEDGHMEPVDVTTLERDDTVQVCLFYPPCTQHHKHKSCWCPECVGNLRFCCCFHYPRYCNYTSPPAPVLPNEPWWAEQWFYEHQAQIEDQYTGAEARVLEPEKKAAEPTAPATVMVEPVSEPPGADEQPSPVTESEAAEKTAPRPKTSVQIARKKRKSKQKLGKKSSPTTPLPPTPRRPTTPLSSKMKTSVSEEPMPTVAALPTFECEKTRRPVSGAPGCFSEPPDFVPLPSLCPFVSTRRAASHIRRVSWPLTQLNIDKSYV
ncbi:hypothetical protein N7520_000153 [Penicillium odoratum]|uniref:uncharacterized protein n=1 Tax=Penicillium odoratum TaxID=1167516 RepID=UPI0025480E0D|nr:uncharacterized protein N7520_000153 [Penicillium odoratum]KAJ5776907.1 hypothetical protein N7520_000153 [Penicillium odoratum]